MLPLFGDTEALDLGAQTYEYLQKKVLLALTQTQQLFASTAPFFQRRYRS